MTVTGDGGSSVADDAPDDHAGGVEGAPDGDGLPITYITHTAPTTSSASHELGETLADLFVEVGPDGEPATRLRTLARHLPIVVWAVDPDGTVRSSFGQGMRRLGLQDGELDGTHISLWGTDGELTISRAIAGESVAFDAEGVFDDRPWAMRNFVVPAPGGGALAVSVDVTERYLVERELGVSEGRFKVLAESAPVGIFLADTTGGNIYTNPALQRQWGRPVDETLERRWIEAVHPDDRALIENRRAASRERGVPFDMQYRIERPDGDERWLEVKARRVFDDSGEHVGYVGTTEDITDRRITEQALLASESRFRTIAESAPIGVFLSDTRTATTYTNPRFREIVGLDEPREHELFGGPTFLESLHPDDLPMVMEATQALLHEGEPFFLVSRVVDDDGSVRWVQSHAVALLDDDGSIIGTVGTLSDVTDRHISEQRLRESEELTRAILETAAEGIVTFDEHGMIQTFNNAAQRIFRRSSQEAVGRSVGVLLPDPHRDVYLGYLRSFRETGETLLAGSPPRELPGLRSDGTTVPIELAITEVHAHGRTIFTGLVRDISERQEFERQLEHQATHDPLTSLPNRALLAAQLESALARAYRHGSSVAVLFVNLDRVKVVTDSLGHRAGDELRVAAAHRLQGVVRPTDTVTRFGEDEFVVLAEDLHSLSDAVDIAQHVIEAMDMPFDLTIDEAFITCNVGISFAVDGLGTAESLIADADLAMFRAKEKGGNRFEIFDTDMRAWINERRKTEVALRHALDREEFELHYQPIVSVAGGGLKGFEALVRWNRGTLGMVPPGDFIPVAEDSGLIIPMGEWILEEACRQIADWQRLHGDQGLSVSVNLSGRQLALRNIADTVARSLAESGAHPSGLTVEITETVLLDDVDQAVRTLGALKDIGVRLSIDDFGTGYSSLTYLRRFPIDTVKIDRSFVSKLGTDSRDASIVNAVILLADGLELDVVAEGVETREQLEALAAMSCDFAQGYYFSRPKPVGELVDFLSGDFRETPPNGNGEH
jgi:diguanylate cyclase (GGDEF)-like protein/PAS domain S-box-containing protein